MAFFAFLGKLVTSILIGYLAFTNSLADMVISVIGNDIPSETGSSVEKISSQTDSLTAVSYDLQELSKRLALAVKNSVPRVLLDSREYQDAAIGAAALGDDATEDTSLPPRDRIERSLVNIFCQYKTEQYVRTTTGTGFFINARGVILTNAHVAQFLLLKDSDSKIIDASCVVRSGNPATPKYRAELLYISPAWIFENSALITEETPRGTGERDYALLYVAKSVEDEALPESFPFISVDTALLTIYTKNTEALTAGYPAEILQRQGARAKLASVVASTTIGDLYTFGSNYADVFTLSNSPVGEQGASGGPVARSNGSVIGLIVTKGNPETDGAHSLRAITLSYIDRTIQEETGFSLAQNIRGDLVYRSKVFRNALVPFLANILTSEITAGE